MAAKTAHKKKPAYRVSAKKSSHKRRSTKTGSATKRRTTKKSARKRTAKKWSGRVTRDSDALDLERSVFKSGSAKKIATSLKASAEHSHRRKAGPFQSAMSMLNFYINRAGKNLTARQRHTLELAKDELRRQFDRA